MSNPQFPPDPRYGTNSLLGCEGVPPPNVGSVGDLATDPITGDVYMKTESGWMKFPTVVEV